MMSRERERKLRDREEIREETHTTMGEVEQ